MEIIVDTGVGDWNFDQAESLLTAGAKIDESVSFHVCDEPPICEINAVTSSHPVMTGNC